MKLKGKSLPVVVKVHEAELEIIFEVGLERGLHEVEVPASPGAKPPPETVTTVPEGPDAGLSLMLGAVLVTVNTANKVCPLVAVMVTWYAPGVTLLTMKLPVMSPCIPSEQPTKLTGDPWIEQLPANGVPGSLAFTVTTVPTRPDDGLSVTELIELTELAGLAYAGYPAKTDVRVRRMSATFRTFCRLMFRSTQ